MIPFLYALGLIASILSLISRKVDVGATILLATGFTLAAGFRVDGFDYDEYVLTIESLRATANQDIDWSIRLLLAKDPAMLLFTDLAAKFDPDATWPVFLAFAILSISTKVAVALSLRRLSTIFLFTYMLFLSPALEFAAIRAGAAMGLVLLALSQVQRTYISAPLMLASIATHISAVLPVAGSLVGKYTRDRKAILLLSMLSGLTMFIGSNLLGTLERGEDFSGNTGTLAAFFFPAFTFMAFILQLAGTKNTSHQIYPAIGICLGVALGLTLPSITIATRFMELGWCLILFAMFRDWSDSSSRQNAIYSISAAFLFLLILSFSNVIRMTWATLFTVIRF